MSKRNKIIYWIATSWLALGMTSTGIVQLIHMEEEVKKMAGLGYSPYVMTMLGILKLIGVIIVLVPRLPYLKEWAYAGFFFNMVGAAYSHIASGSQVLELFGPSLLLVLTMTSWYFRPADRKISSQVS